MAGIQLDGKVALVTGASRGIGAVVACHLAQAGAKVGVNYHTSSEAAEIIVDSINKSGGDALLVGGDVSQEDNPKEWSKNWWIIMAVLTFWSIMPVSTRINC
ncbi:MAG: hypothetical protein Ct9H300mP11_24770 [Chloroflexota bacterium]|nr:MAG: hypothetical protein Ct9H300mP11_24770 [Chloroflexota bacterium]